MNNFVILEAKQFVGGLESLASQYSWYEEIAKNIKCWFHGQAFFNLFGMVVPQSAFKSILGFYGIHLRSPGNLSKFFCSDR
jgi:hypothetical protein